MADEETTVEAKPEVIRILSVIAKPLAGKKLTKRLFKVIKKAAKAKALRRGVKEVVKAIRKKEKGFAIIAGDISPIDVITHLPLLCEEAEIPYVYVASKDELGAAGNTKRPTSCVFLPRKDGTDFLDAYDECITEVKTVQEPIY
mmetsp:Transcript_29109/g.47042  ORF Transcript_29109/g.47042 Transcript_29109/m.47042 type:complete len:144 (+) Transcript_29109:35-466(+)|eukprot:CAMPEP_0184644086 /NCGR_PEP_ID=MMETSP0308-20130426/855_1 /TAXON_ID=38269 /ORGANISM="Gloeochaete witrockiana, Strain SAG 46.84" /LENGTH=143 /DNA_ID=CAMNT_0027072409 /DNA_START=23 /DNA_END=454 /DNA_ORIENTATION=+